MAQKLILDKNYFLFVPKFGLSSGAKHLISHYNILLWALWYLVLFVWCSIRGEDWSV